MRIRTIMTVIFLSAFALLSAQTTVTAPEAPFSFEPMGQIKLIHEHYDSKPWAGIISGTLFAILAITKLVVDSKDHTWIYLVLFGLVILPTVVILVMDIIWKKKPTLVVYNDRLEVMKPMSSKRVEILYSEIKNMALQSGQLRVWLDEYSQPACYNLGANVNKTQESYDILVLCWPGILMPIS